MEIVQAYVRDIHLHFFLGTMTFAPSFLIRTFFTSELLSYLEEAPLNLLFNFRLKLFLHVISFKILPFEMLQWVHGLFMLASLLRLSIIALRLMVHTNINLIVLWRRSLAYVW